jgi:rhomboid family GlyGly-CTERM serine protease
MTKTILSPNLMLCAALSTLMLLLTAVDSALFPLLSLYADKVNQGEIWRLFTANLVHFGWVHTLMNIAALLLCCVALLNETSVKQFSALLLWCCLSVGLGVYLFNPEYAPYAGLSGALHGLIVAGLLPSRIYPVSVRALALVLVVAKLWNENSGDYEATDLQQLIPAAVAVESHLYGAIGGFIFACGNWLTTHFANSLKTATQNRKR